MIRILATEETERVLRAEDVGRIGCQTGGRTYVVPVSYVYDNGAVYAHSEFGQKIEMMRQNPAVCFEVDHIEDLVNWNSAICWGTYEELHGDDATYGLQLLRERLESDMPRTLEHGELAAEHAAGDDSAIVFRINLTETSGREERLHWELLPHAAGSKTAASPGSFVSTPAERWLSHERAQQLADAAGVLDAEDIWTAADKLAQGRPVAEITASFVYRGINADLAKRLAACLAELRDSALPEVRPTGASIHATGISEWSDMIPEDVLAERDAEERGMVSLPAEGDH